MKTLFLFLFPLTLFSEDIKLNKKFIENEISIFKKNVKLYGSLIQPKKVIKTPLVITISGSGPTDRNGNNPNMTNNCLMQLAYSLSKNNISSFRFDKRAIGKSKIENFKEDNLVFDDFVEDLISWIDTLQKTNQFSKIYLAGHSEGSLIGILAAQNTAINGFISLAGAAQSVSDIIQQQLQAAPVNLQSEAKQYLDSLKQGKMIENVNKNLYALFRPSVQPYMISWIKYFPYIEIQKLNIPTLIIQGDEDWQVNINQSQILHQNSKNSKIKILVGVNHILKQVGKDKKKNIDSYSNPNFQIEKNIIESIIQFILKHDNKNLFHFASLQSEFGKEFLIKNQLNRPEFDTVV